MRTLFPFILLIFSFCSEEAIDFPAKGKSIYIIGKDNKIRILPEDIVSSSLKKLKLFSSPRKANCKMNVYFGTYNANGVNLMGEIDTASNCVRISDTLEGSAYWEFKDVKSFISLIENSEPTELFKFVGDSLFVFRIQQKVYVNYNGLLLPSSKLDANNFVLYIPRRAFESSTNKTDILKMLNLK